MALDTVHADVAIIGAGTAGMTAYRSATRRGKRAVLIESGPFGTMCARVGCMPSKLLIAAADAAHAARTAKPFGIDAGTVTVDGQQVMHRVRTERDRFVSFVLDDVNAMDSDNKLVGHARFLSDTRIQVGEHTIVHTNATVIATGTTPVKTDVLSHLGDRVVVNDDVFDWTRLPQRVLVVGAGVIGLELGQALARLGVQTTIVSRSEGVGGLTDTVVRDSATQAFQLQLDLRLHTEVSHASKNADGIHVTLKSSHGQGSDATLASTLTVDYILMAIGRRAALDGLGLENTSVVMDAGGQPVLNEDTLQLGSAPIFMAGDVTSSLPVLHEAADEGYIAGANAATFPIVESGDRRAPLAIVFTDPQLARVGKSFKELPQAGVIIGDVDFSNQGRSRVMLKNYGKLRLYAHAGSGQFLGAEMAGPAMEHIAHLLAWACQQGLSIHDMLKMPFYHPVVEEGLRTALRNTARQLPAD